MTRRAFLAFLALLTCLPGCRPVLVHKTRSVGFSYGAARLCADLRGQSRQVIWLSESDRYNREHELSVFQKSNESLRRSRALMATVTGIYATHMGAGYAGAPTVTITEG